MHGGSNRYYIKKKIKIKFSNKYKKNLKLEKIRSSQILMF